MSRTSFTSDILDKFRNDVLASLPGSRTVFYVTGEDLWTFAIGLMLVIGLYLLIRR